LVRQADLGKPQLSRQLTDQALVLGVAIGMDQTNGHRLNPLIARGQQ
jgi:hypothetical protein